MLKFLKTFSIYSAAVFLALVLISTAAAAQQDTANQAREAYYQEDYEEAENLWLEIDDTPGYVWEANFFLGMTYLRMGAYENAVEHMEAAVGERQEDYTTLVNYARALYNDGRIEKARRVLMDVPSNLRDYDEQFYNVRGLLAMAEEDLERAIRNFELAIDINAKNPYLQNNIGLALIRGEDYERAIEHLEEAAAQDPNEAYIYNNLGFSYLMQNEVGNAIENFERALEIDPDHQGARTNLENVQ